MTADERGQRRRPTGLSLGRLAGATQVLFAGLLAIVASFAAEPGFLPRGVVIFLVFAIPALVGWLGAVRRRPTLLFGAGLTSFVGAFIAFSGVTLIFLIPALLFVFGAVQLQGSGGTPGRESIARGIARAGAALAIVLLLAGAGGSALLITDEGCWADYRDSGGRASLTIHRVLLEPVIVGGKARSAAFPNIFLLWRKGLPLVELCLVELCNV